MIRGDKSEDLEKAISEIESRHTRDPIQLITPVIPAPTPAPIREESKEIVEEKPEPVLTQMVTKKTSFAEKISGAQERRGKLLKMMEDSLKARVLEEQDKNATVNPDK